MLHLCLCAIYIFAFAFVCKIRVYICVQHTYLYLLLCANMYLYLRIDHSLLKRSPWGPGGGNSGEPFVCERGDGELGKGGDSKKVTIWPRICEGKGEQDQHHQHHHHHQQ